MKKKNTKQSTPKSSSSVDELHSVHNLAWFLLVGEGGELPPQITVTNINDLFKTIVGKYKTCLGMMGVVEERR